MPFAFDADTAVEPDGAGRFRAEISGRWNVGDKPNGGYLLALAVRAAGRVCRQPDPLTATAHFVRPAVPGPAAVEVDVVREGRSMATAEVRVRQADRELCRCLVTFGTIPGRDDPALHLAPPPPLPPVEECLHPPARMPDGTPVELVNRYRYGVDPATVGWAAGQPGGTAETRGWLRFSDGREPDALALAAAVDAFVPAVFDLGISGWVPTLDLNVQFRRRPAPGWLRVAVATRFVVGSYVEEDAEVWDSDGCLVGLGRQLARFSGPFPDRR